MAYHLSSVPHVCGVLDQAASQQVFDWLVLRHETLRTRLEEVDGQARQTILANMLLRVVLEGCAEASETTLRQWVAEEARQPLDLAHGPLPRMRLLAPAGQEHVLVVTQHHIVPDGQSMQAMVGELFQAHTAVRRGEQPMLAPLKLQYADHAAWHRVWLDSGEGAQQLDYQRERLGAEQPVLKLLAGRVRSVQASGRRQRLGTALPVPLSEELLACARRESVTLFILLLASFQVLLKRYSGQLDTCVGVPIVNRNRAEVERLIDFFANTQVLRCQVDAGLAFRDLLGRVREAALGAQAHRDLPFEQLVDVLQPERNLSHSPSFQVMYNHQNGERQDTQVDGLHTESFAWDDAAAQFDLIFGAWETPDGLGAALAYATDPFKARTVERMARHWQNLLCGILENSQVSVDSLPVLDAEECGQLPEGWNATTTEYPLQRGVHRLFEEQVERTPTASVLAFSEECLDYAELNRRASRLTHALIERGIGVGRLVGVAVERSIEMVVALMAILKAGGAYVSVDPECPEKRQAYTLEDSGVELLLSRSHLKLPLTQGVQRIDLDRGVLWFEDYSEASPDTHLDGENLAHVIYTSGSTGKPKGVGNRHSALSNRLHWMQQAHGLGVDDTVLQKTPFSFDVSVREFF